MSLILWLDIDGSNISSSRKVVSDNKLDDRITILETKPNDPLIPIDRLDVDRLDFVMCNPPFYESEEELVSSARAKSRPPFSACTGAAVEMITPGGEVAFIESLVQQSLALKTHILWYTSMFGKLSSVSVVVQKLLDSGINNWAVTEFVQGKGTRRWAVGWSFSDWRPRSDVSRGITSLPKHLLPFPSHYNFEILGRHTGSLEHIINKINIEFSPLRYFHYTWYSKQSCIGYAKEDIWSRKARRKFAREQHDGETISHDEKALDVVTAALGFRIDLSLQADHSVDVVVRWIKGSDQVLFESFCGMLKRKLTEE
uniref:Putative methyltransferase-like protein C27D7.08c n=1 Tax=Talaromyces marneffei PM1 TaxID=1077442 RepID=A0A093XCN2_TALMA